jgi:hypothetical protein
LAAQLILKSMNKLLREERSEPISLVRDTFIEMQLFLPADFNGGKDKFEQFLVSLAPCREPVSFELVGTSSRTTVQFAVHPHDESLVREELHACFPEAVVLRAGWTLERSWKKTSEAQAVITEFGLAREFMLPLASSRLDLFIAITRVFAALKPEEIGIYQVIFKPLRIPGSESSLPAATNSEDGSSLMNARELLYAARFKISKTLYAAVVRVAARSPHAVRKWEILRLLASALGTFARPRGNELIPLGNDDYPREDHELDLLSRQCRRSAMILNSDELIGLVHLPSAEVRLPRLSRQTQKPVSA